MLGNYKKKYAESVTDRTVCWIVYAGIVGIVIATALIRFVVDIVATASNFGR